MQALEWLTLGLIPTLPLAFAAGDSARLLALLAALPLGFLLQQLERFRLEVLCRGFDRLERPALAFLRKHLQLRSPADAYAVYEVAFYRHPEWQAARDHVHRCWHWAVLLRSAAVSCALAAAATVVSVLAAGQPNVRGDFPVARTAVALLLLATGAALWRKGQHTEELLHRFDCGWVAAHWQEYAQVAAALGIETRAAEEASATPCEPSPALHKQQGKS
jgi:hypothetical protein